MTFYFQCFIKVYALPAVLLIMFIMILSLWENCKITSENKELKKKKRKKSKKQQKCSKKLQSLEFCTFFYGHGVKVGPGPRDPGIRNPGNPLKV